MKFRKAEAEDVFLTYEWATDPVVRQNSFSNNKIDFENHREWFLSKINNRAVLYLIAEDEGESIGQLRFRKNADHSVIGVTIAPSKRGKGYGTKILTEGIIECTKYWNLPVYAFIKIDNIASIKAFEKAGFKLSKELDYLGHRSKLYIWK